MNQQTVDTCTRCGGAHRHNRCPLPHSAAPAEFHAEAPTPHLAPGMIINEGLCKQLVAEYFRRTHSLRERPAVVLRELMQTTYAQGFATAARLAGRDAKYAERYRHVRDLAVDQTGVAGQPCIALPTGPAQGCYLTEEDADLAIDESIQRHAARAGMEDKRSPA